MPDRNDFSMAGYEALICGFVDRDYQIVQYADVAANARHLIVRHDVDFDLDLAVQMAEMEADRGWTATYLVLMRTEFYNPFSKAGSAALKKLESLNHIVGLHFDAALYSANEDALRLAVGREADLLGSLLDKPVTAFSFHRPHPDLLDHSFEVAGLINAYGKKFFRDIGYSSDSRGGWHHGHPLDHPHVKQGSALQLLIHPIWWTVPGSSPHNKCASFLDRRYDLLDGETAKNCTSYSRRRR